MTKKNTFLMIAALTLAACGGGSGETNAATPGLASSDPFYGIAVPPEPDPVSNNSTILGIDANGNGVRDDVERVIAAKYGANPSKYDAVMRGARSNQEFLEANGDAAKSTAATLKATLVGACMFDKFGGDGIAGNNAIEQLVPLILNTSARLAAYGATVKASRHVSTTIPSDPCQ